MNFRRSFRAAMARLTAFRRSKRANVAMIFALSAIPVVIAVGGGWIWRAPWSFVPTWPVRWMRRVSRWGHIRAHSGADGDARAAIFYFKLHECNILRRTGSRQRWHRNRWDRRFNKHDNGHATVPMPTVLMRIIGITTINVGLFVDGHLGSDEALGVVSARQYGSMSETDGTGLSKISALKTAATQMLTNTTERVGQPRRRPGCAWFHSPRTSMSERPW